MSFDWNWVKAGASLKKALDLDPDNILALINSVNLANHLGHFDEAITLSKRAIALDPLRVRSYYNLSLINYYDGKSEEANAAVIKAIELDPTLSIAYYQQTRVLLAQGKAEMALESIQKESVEAWRMYGLTLVYFKLNRKAESDSTLKNTIKKHSDYGAYQIAEAYAYRGEIEQAFKWLERAYRQRDDGLASMKVSPLLKNLHSDARWKPFLKKMKLPVD